MNQDISPAQSRSHLILPVAMAAAAAALGAITVAQAALPSRPSIASAPEPAQAAVAAADADEPAERTPGPFDWGRPVAHYPIISPFGLRQLPWEEHGRLHAGVDIAAPAGTPVRVAAHGVVVRAGRDDGYGRFVEVRHAGGVSSLYAHLGAVADGIAPGSALMQGAEVGSIGNSGSSTGAHLHLEVRDSRGRPLNPEMFLGQAFASADALPLKAAGRFPRRVRVAYVSFIPKARLEQMREREDRKKEAAEEKLQAKAAAEAAKLIAAASADETADETAEVSDASAPVAGAPPVRLPSGRVHATFEAG